MPTAPLTYCASPGCHMKVHSGLCVVHAKKQAQTQTRQGSYGRPWRRLRDAHLVDHPWCVHCLEQGQHVVADEVDHIQPHRGHVELLRDPTNLQSLCKSHHSAKTAREVGFGG